MKKILSLLMMAACTMSAWAADTWVETAPNKLATGDVVVIVDKTSSRAMFNGNGTSAAPTAVEVTLNDDQTQITSTVASTLQWELTVTNGTKYQFAVPGTTNYLYGTNANNGLRVGTNTNNVFNITADYLCNEETGRYVGVYNNQDWRCYTSVNNNIKDTETAFYKKVTVQSAVETPVIAGETPFVGSTTVTITCATQGATIYYTIDGTEPTNQSTEYTAPFELTEAATVKAIAYDVTGATSAVASKEFVKTLSVATIAEALELDDNTEFVFTGNLVVSAQSSNTWYLYAQDETGGILIYSPKGYTLPEYNKGDVIPARFSAKFVKDFKGAPEFINPTGFEAATETADIVAEEMTPAQVTVDPYNLFFYGVIKGATITEGEDGKNYITDGENSVVVYDRFGVETPADLDKTYDVYGIPGWYNGAQFMPLEFVEVVEQQTEAPMINVQVGEESYTVEATGAGEVKLYADGVEVENPYVIARTEEEQTIVFTATAQEQGKSISEISETTLVVPALVPQVVESFISFTAQQERGTVAVTLEDGTPVESLVTKVAEGEVVTVTATAAQGFMVTNIVVKAGEIVITPSDDPFNGEFGAPRINADGSRVMSQTFEMPAEDVAITVTFDTRTGIENINMENVKAVRYFNAAGVESATPFQGVNIVVREMNDGSKTVSKMVK